MRLSITIKKAPLGSHHMIGERFSFDDRSLTFGRADSNDLILPDPQCFVSSRHGMIELTNGKFTVHDQSSNGLFLNSEESPLGHGNKTEVATGTLLKAGDYRLEIEIEEAAAPKVEISPASSSPPVVPIRSDINPHPHSPEEDVAVLLAMRLGLHGMSEEKLNSMPEEVTTLIRRCIGSVMDVLSARRQVKTQLKMENTVIQRVHNNPLKVSASADDAIERMFAKSGETYLAPEQALVEAFQDIGDHQVAMMAATLQVYQQVVDRFEPAAIEKKLPPPESAGGIFGGKRKMWDEYKNNYETIAANGTENVHEAFLREFSAAYSEQLLKLKKERGKGSH